VFCLMTVSAWAAPEEDRTMGHGDASEIVVAKANGHNIYMAALMGRMLDISQERFGKREITPVLASKIKNESLEQLIMEELTYQAASKEVKVGDKEVEEAVAARIKSFGGEENLQKYMDAYQLKDKAAFAEQIRRYLVVQKYIAQNIDPKVRVSDKLVEAAYKGEAGAYFNKPEVVQVTKIIFFLDPANASTLAKVKAVRKKILGELKGDPTKLVPDGTFIVQENIKLNPRTDKKLYDAAKKLDKFALSEPVESGGTLHLLQLTGYQAPVHKELDEVRGYLKNEISGRIKQDMIKKWMASLRREAHVEIIDLTH